jgi:hypothetical protein
MKKRAIDCWETEDGDPALGITVCACGHTATVAADEIHVCRWCGKKAYYMVARELSLAAYNAAHRDLLAKVVKERSMLRARRGQSVPSHGRQRRAPRSSRQGRQRAVDVARA